MTDGQKLDFVFYHLGKWYVFPRSLTRSPNLLALMHLMTPIVNGARICAAPMSRGFWPVTTELTYNHTYGRPSGAYYDARESLSTSTSLHHKSGASANLIVNAT